jgi:2-oxoglutarate dehydrogenase complex dehydrogenase (E1) component-like enzyme
MIDGYRSIGHQFAKVDPLQLAKNKNRFERLADANIAPSAFGY